VTLLAEADVALSISMTAVSTLTAGAMTPLLTSLLLGSLVPVDTAALLRTTLQVVLLPVALGLVTNSYLLPSLPPSLTRGLARSTPMVSGLLVAAICGKVVATNAAAVLQSGGSLLGAVLALHSFGFFFGFWMARALGFSRQVAKTVSIETGMQNSALAVVLARSSLPHPLSGLPGAVSAVCHSVLGSLAAWVWSREGDRRGKGAEG
jgi:BASS family bile acid:Na+ symporter